MKFVTYNAVINLKRKKHTQLSEAIILKKKKKPGSQTKQNRYIIVQETFSKTTGGERRTGRT